MNSPTFKKNPTLTTFTLKLKQNNQNMSPKLFLKFQKMYSLNKLEIDAK
jgi:hypothetical protein